MDVRNYFVSDRNFFIFKTYNVIIIAMEKAFRIFTVITVSVMTLFLFRAKRMRHYLQRR